MVTWRIYSPGSLNSADVVALPLKTNLGSPASSFSTTGFSLEKATFPGPRYFDQVTVTGIGLRLRGLAPEFENHLASSETHTASGSGFPTLASRLIDMPCGPWTTGPGSLKSWNRRVAGVSASGPTSAAALNGDIS